MDKENIAKAGLAALWVDGQVMDIGHLGLGHWGGLQGGAVEVNNCVRPEGKCHQVPHQLAIRPCAKTSLRPSCDLDREALGGLEKVSVIGELLKFKNVGDIGCDERANDKR